MLLFGAIAKPAHAFDSAQLIFFLFCAHWHVSAWLGPRDVPQFSVFEHFGKLQFCYTRL